MCGIGAWFQPGSHALQEEARAFVDRLGLAMSARGPDDQSVLFEGDLALVHRRLSIVDPQPRSNQPMQSDGWIVCFNGEIVNFRDLRNRIGSRYAFRTSGDGEVLLASLEILGLDETLASIAGMFAFLAYEKKTGTLHAVRDPLGIKPLVMARSESGAFVFASSVGAILAAEANRPRALNREALASYFSLGGICRGTDTAYAGIERLGPANILSVNADGKVVKWRYWTPRFSPDFSMDDLVSIVREYAFSDVPSALFLSGGVDSTFLAAVIDNLDGFHLSSPETDYAKAVAGRFSRRFVEVTPSVDDYTADLGTVTRFHGEPLMSCGIPNIVSKAVAQAGYKMAISANGADELFLGYPRTPAPEWRATPLPNHETPPEPHFTRQIAHIFRDPRGAALGMRLPPMHSLREIANEALRDDALSEDFPASAAHRWFELRSYVLSDLNPALDAASMANSIEARVPFLDHRIVEGVLSWDANRLIDPVRGRKAPLKAYLERWFPLSFFNRQKLGFSIHRSALPQIARAGPDALRAYEKSGRITLKAVADHEYAERDRVYLGSACAAHAAWCWDRLPQ